MLLVKDIVEFLTQNKGSTEWYSDYRIQIYTGDRLQANISHKAENEAAFIKIDQHIENSIDIFLDDTKNPGIINYSEHCRLLYDENILSLAKKFDHHPKIEKALISLLELQLFIKDKRGDKCISKESKIILNAFMQLCLEGGGIDFTEITPTKLNMPRNVFYKALRELESLGYVTGMIWTENGECLYDNLEINVHYGNYDFKLHGLN